LDTETCLQMSSHLSALWPPHYFHSQGRDISGVSQSRTLTT